MTYNYKQLLKYKTPAELDEYLKVAKNKPTNSELYHALAYIAKQPLVKDGSGLISAELSLAQWNLADLELCGIMKLFTHAPRGKIFRGSATDADNLRFSALTPLVLSAYKQLQGISYRAWNWLDPKLRYLLDADIYALQPYIVSRGMLPEYSDADYAQFVADINKPPQTIWSPNCRDLVKYPRLLKVQLLQTWIAYPTLRNEYMILDCDNLDAIPTSIYGDIQVFDDSNNPFTTYVAELNTEPTKLPWE